MSETTLSPEVYRDNLEFWQKAWNMVKTPYTQMPDLPYIPKIPAALQPQQAELILDLGCGSGWLSVFLCRSGFKMLGVDVAAHAIELAKTWAAQENLDIDFQVQDISALNFEDAKFGGVVANSIFEHLNFALAEQAVATLERIMKPGAVFVACFDKVGTGPGEYFKLEDGTHVYTDKGRRGMMLRCFSDEEIRKLFSGFEIIEFSEVSEVGRFFIAKRK